MSLREKILQAQATSETSFSIGVKTGGIQTEGGAIEPVKMMGDPVETIEDSSYFMEDWQNETNLSDQEFADLQQYILDFMREETDELNLDMLTKEQVEFRLIELIRRKDKQRRIKEEHLYPLVKSLANDIKGYGPIQEFMDMPEVTDIRIIGDKCTRYKIRGRYYTSEKPEHRFRSEAHLHNWINRKIALSRMGGRFDKTVARVNALLPDGSRLHAVTTISGIDEEKNGKSIPTPYTIVSIRKFSKRYSVEELVKTEYELKKERQEEWNQLLKRYEGASLDDLYQKNRFMSLLIMAYLHLICRLRFTILLAGGMGTGKTTMLNAIFPFIPSYHVNGILEEAPEMQPDHPQTIRLWERPANTEKEGAIVMEDLMKEILRMDVNRFFISELRDSIAYLFLQGIINGHPGGGSTLHANSVEAALLRLISLACAYPGSDRQDVLHMIAEGIQTIIHIEKTDDDEKYIAEIAEVVGMKDGDIALKPIFTVEFAETGEWGWRFHGLSERVRKEARKARIAIPTILQEPRDAFKPQEQEHQAS